MGRKRKNTITVDMRGIESSGRVKEGPNVLTVDTVEVKEGDQGQYLTWQFSASTGGKVWENTSLTPQSLWKLRGLLEALGVEIPEGVFDLDLEDYVGLECGAEIEHETYQGKKKGVIVDLFSSEEVSETGGADSDEEEEDEEEDEEAFNIKDLSQKDLIILAIEMDLTTKDKAKKLTVKKLLKLFKDEDDEDIAEAWSNLSENEEEEDDEEEEKPKSKSNSKSKKKPAGKIKKGSKVTFEDDNEEYEGIVTKIKGDIYFVETDDAEWELELEDLTLDS